MDCREYTAYLLSNSFKLNDSVEPAVIKRKGKWSNRNIHNVLFNQQRAVMEEKWEFWLGSGALSGVGQGTCTPVS